MIIFWILKRLTDNMPMANAKNIQEFINLSVNLLEDKKISDARLNAELMLCNILNCKRLDLYLNFEKPLNYEEIQKYEMFLQRRLKYEPVQYILGKTEFYGIEFLVNNKVLIPRQETEILVEKLIEDIKSSGLKKVKLFEIGTGSGCISIALAKNLIAGNIEVEIFSIDISGDAIEVANENLKINGLESSNLRFYEKDLFEIQKLNKDFDYIISNPPYISRKEFDKLEVEVKDYEPEISLTDNADGLKYYEKIFQIASDNLFTGKVFCEIGFGQRESIEKIIKKNNFTNYTFYNDYNNIHRVIEVRK